MWHSLSPDIEYSSISPEFEFKVLKQPTGFSDVSGQECPKLYIFIYIYIYIPGMQGGQIIFPSKTVPPLHFSGPTPSPLHLRSTIYIIIV